MNRDDEVFVAVDQGGHATRALAYDRRGQRLVSAVEIIDTRRDARGHVEHDGENLVASVGAVLEEVSRRVPATRWAAAGLAVQRSTIACWDRESGELLAPVISWQDRRQADWLGRFANCAAHVHRITGLPLSPHYGASKLRWCLDHVPAVREACDAGRLCAGPLASLLLGRLLEGRPCVSDEANASRTQLWSPVDRDWSPELLGLFGVPESVLPGLVPTMTHFGTLRAAGAAVPFTVCTGDQAAAPFAAGRLDGSAVYVNLGTGAFALRPVESALIAPPLLTSVLASDAANVAFVLEGTVNGAGSALDWFEREEGLPAARLLAGLERAPPAALDAPFFLNGVAGLGSPFWKPDFESRYVGDAEPAARFRAVVESIAFLLRANLDELARHTGRPRRIIASGGLAQSGFLVRTLAAATGLPVHRLTDSEATARGVAFLAAGQPGEWLAPLPEIFEPAEDPVLQARYAQWLALLEGALPR